jgi:hypothetical protein
MHVEKGHVIGVRLRGLPAFAVALGFSVICAVCPSSVAHAKDVQLAQDDEIERPDGSAVMASSTPGPLIDLTAQRPDLGKGATQVCSRRFPICVHSAHKLQSLNVASALGSAERAWDALTGPMGLPAPDVSIETGAYDVYLVPEVVGEVVTRLDERDVRTRVDRANAFTLLDARLSAGCPQDAAMAYGVARAVQMRAAPAADEGSARAEAQSLASLIVPCATSRIAGGASIFQSHPELTFADTLVNADEATSLAFDRGASLFYTWLDEIYGQYAGSIVSAMWSLAPTVTSLSASRWNNEPDGFDVLRKSFKDALSHGSDIDDLWLDFAVARAFMGSRGDGKHGLESLALGDAGAVLYDWEIDFPDHARSLGSRRPLAPLGSAYFSIRTKDISPTSRLRIEASWEEHAKMKLAVVRLNDAGAELGRLVIGAPKKATNAQMTVVDLIGVSRVLIVAVNTGDFAYPFDPDDMDWEPHELTVSIAPE